MLILGINTATAHAEIALMEQSGNKFSKKIFRTWISNHDEASKILPALAEALKKEKDKLDKIFVVSGPGAFTGLRIGVTVANALALLHGAQISEMSTFEYLRAKIKPEHQKNTALLLKAGGEFAAIQKPGSEKTERLNASGLKAFFAKNKKIKFVVTDASPAERKKYLLPKNVKWISHNQLHTLAAIMENVFRGKHLQHKLVKPRYLLPPKITQSKKPIFT